MNGSSKIDGACTLGVWMRDWFNGGDPDGHAKLCVWIVEEDDRWRGYTHSMGRYITWFVVIACVFYLFIRGISSILVLLVAIFLMGGRAVIKRQVRCNAFDPEETKRQWGLTRNPEYLWSITLHAEGLLEDNKILAPDSRSLLQGCAQQVHERPERGDEKRVRKARKAEKKARREGTGHEFDGSTDTAMKNEKNKATDGS